MGQNKKVLEFVSQNGEELSRSVFLNVHNIMVPSSDYFWDIIKKSGQAELFKDENQAFLALLGAFISIRTEIEMQAIYEKYGDDVYSMLGEFVSSYYDTFLRNYVDNEEEFAVFLMHNAHETMLNNDGENLDIVIAEQFSKIAGLDENLNPSLFQPLMPVLLEGETLVELIEGNVSIDMNKIL